ncbi:hypothetical protein DPMN_176556 [Dreissena polymorpha]|uniref:Uncharacterized protein n=1 Tax=Dreissena polymorpha TaxID=45954 RepID=A0A9D4IKQ3_DREPO|nr:hypothetical protein DPMN_176556 [Dreissena polymorpha]
MMSTVGSFGRNGWRTIQKLSQAAELSSSWLWQSVKMQLGSSRAIDIHIEVTVAHPTEMSMFQGRNIDDGGIPC